MFHRTERLFLRPGFPEDWQAIHAAMTDEGVVRNLARAPWPYREDDAKFFASMQQDPYLPHFLVTIPGHGVIGSAGMGDNDGSPEIGYWIARDHWGRGYATEAAKGVIEVARMIGYRRLTAGHFVDNPNSGKVLRKVGFRPTGKVRPRHSLARGAETPSVEFELDLDGPVMELPQAA